MTRVVDLDGAAHLVFPDTVVPLHPEEAVFEAMLDGWHRQQTSRQLRPTMEQRDARSCAGSRRSPTTGRGSGRRRDVEDWTARCSRAPAVGALDGAGLPERARAVLRLS